jgi:hypothetical protein
MHKHENLFDDASDPELPGPKWLDALMRDYFDDQTIPARDNTRPDGEVRFLRRGVDIALSAHALCRLREPVREQLAMLRPTDVPTLYEVVARAASDVGMELGLIARWIDPPPPTSLQESLRNPETFARLAVALQVCLTDAVGLFRAERLKVATAATIPSPHSGCAVVEVADYPKPQNFVSGSVEEESILRSYYQEAGDDLR